MKLVRIYIHGLSDFNERVIFDTFSRLKVSNEILKSDDHVYIFEL